MHSRKLLRFIIVGGLAYTIGAIIQFMQWPGLIPGIIEHHEIFHIFVLIGAYYHWRCVYEISKYPISSKIVIVVRELPGNIFQAKATSENVSFTASSKQEIKEVVLKWIEDKFHHEMKPSLVNFKYTKEEDIHLPD